MQHWPVAINLVEFRKIYGQVARVCNITCYRCGKKGHRCNACDGWRIARTLELNLIRSDKQGQLPDESADADHYLVACHWLQHVKGLRIALNDMRNLMKLVCLLPRHPDDTAALRPHRRRRGDARDGSRHL